MLEHPNDIHHALERLVLRQELPDQVAVLEYHPFFDLVEAPLHLLEALPEPIALVL